MILTLIYICEGLIDNLCSLTSSYFPVRYIRLLSSGYSSVYPTDQRALICRWHLHNAMTQQRYNDTSVTRGPAGEKAGR